ncbi:MAG: glyoxalase/bleomycin resistance/dioxygenase family protein [Alphaproteobacteria bacterium]|nr:MAG: glyoxalase/bleomycin resistance/dioxygenase family protein [Alphaproteobacteria bacterium]
MKRLHVNLSVADLDQSIAFYNALFASEPTVLKDDYAKWMLDDPRVNFAITSRGDKKGVDHLGIQVESDDELAEVYGRLKQAGRPIFEEGDTVCCYAQSEKSWIADPEGVSWETFLTKGESTTFGGDVREADGADKAAACCSPAEEAAAACCGAAKEAARPAPTGSCC